MNGASRRGFRNRYAWGSSLTLLFPSFRFVDNLFNLFVTHHQCCKIKRVGPNCMLVLKIETTYLQPLGEFLLHGCKLNVSFIVLGDQ